LQQIFPSAINIFNKHSQKEDFDEDFLCSLTLFSISHLFCAFYDQFPFYGSCIYTHIILYIGEKAWIKAFVIKTQSYYYSFFSVHNTTKVLMVKYVRKFDKVPPVYTQNMCLHAFMKRWKFLSFRLRAEILSENIFTKLSLVWFNEEGPYRPTMNKVINLCETSFSIGEIHERFQ
jgi:hypothetical protein